MSKKVTQIALKIALIRAEFTESEILKAVRLLEEKGVTSSLLDYLAERDIKPITSTHSPRRKTKPIREQRSQVVIDLELKDPEKYKILSEFDVLLRKSSILPNVRDIRKLGEQLNKEFPNVKSRRDAVSKLMAVLANLPIEDAKNIMQQVLSSSKLQESEYQQLAKFIITGEN